MSLSDDAHLSPEVRFVVETSRRLLFAALDGLEGEKTVVWDRSLMKRVNLFAGPSVLSAHGVVSNSAIDQCRGSETQSVVFFLSPTIQALDALCTYIDTNGKDTKSLYYVYFIPEAWYVVREKLKERENGRYFERLEAVKELALWWLPQNGDCLSMAQPELPSRLLINGDWTHLHRCAVALSQLIELSPGQVPIYSRGKWATDVARMVSKMASQTESSQPAVMTSSLRFNRVVIVDRWLDPLTPLLTQLTYGGLLDEIYGISMVQSIKVPEAEFAEKEDGDPFEMREIYLNDELFHRLKHVHINAIGQQLAGILQEIKKDEQFDREKMSVAEYQVLVRKMPQIIRKKKLCSVHMRLAEMVRAHLYDVFVDLIKVQKDLLESSDGDKMNIAIEDAILDATDLTTVLRLVAVHSLTAGGLKSSVLCQYRRMIMQSYGVEAVNHLLKMQKMGLIRDKSAGSKLVSERSPMLFAQLKKQYELLVDDVTESDSSNPAYAYSGFCPVLFRVIEEGDRVKWVAWNKTGEHGGGDDNRTAVFIVGGASRAELALIGRLPNISLVATSALITGDSFLNNITRI